MPTTRERSGALDDEPTRQQRDGSCDVRLEGEELPFALRRREYPRVLRAWRAARSWRGRLRARLLTAPDIDVIDLYGAVLTLPLDRVQWVRDVSPQAVADAAADSRRAAQQERRDALFDGE